MPGCLSVLVCRCLFVLEFSVFLVLRFLGDFYCGGIVTWCFSVLGVGGKRKFILFGIVVGLY